MGPHSGLVSGWRLFKGQVKGGAKKALGGVNTFMESDLARKLAAMPSGSSAGGSTAIKASFGGGFPPCSNSLTVKRASGKSGDLSSFTTGFRDDCTCDVLGTGYCEIKVGPGTYDTTAERGGGCHERKSEKRVTVESGQTVVINPW